MGKRGPQPSYPERLSIELGESIHTQWLIESESSKLPRALIARLAVDEYCNDQDTAIILPTSLSLEEQIRSSLQLSREQMSRLANRSRLLDTPISRIASYAIAYRYSSFDYQEVRLLVAKTEY